jgi:hypothetical protein
MKKAIIITIIILFVCSCKKDYYDKGTAVFYNKSNQDVILLRDYISYAYFPQYDTAMPCNLEEWCRFVKVGRNEKLSFIHWNDTDKISASDTFSIFVLDKQVFSNYSWKQICDDYMVLCRYDLSGNDLQFLNSTVPYPPTSEMKNMKMFPLYEEIIKDME